MMKFHFSHTPLADLLFFASQFDSHKRPRDGDHDPPMSFHDVHDDDVDPLAQSSALPLFESAAVPIVQDVKRSKIEVPASPPMLPPPTAVVESSASARLQQQLTQQQQQSILPAVQLLQKTKTHVARGDDVLASQRQILLNSAIPMPDAEFEDAKNTQNSIRSQLTSAQEQLNMIRETVLLRSDDQVRLLTLIERIALQLRQLDLFGRELDYIHRYNMEPPPAVDLFIVDQPFPVSVYHHKPLPGPLRVQLLTSARCALHVVGRVSADVLYETPQKAKNDIVMKNSEKKMVDGESSDKEADFAALTFEKGTRLHQVTLKFKQQVRVSELGGGASSAQFQHLESQASRPFIVTTHENQWAAAEGALFESVLFDDKTSAPWPLVANQFQTLYLRATRQPYEKPTRPLALEDLAYVQQKLGRMATVERAVWAEFWKWLEEGLRKIRFAKHLCDMWVTGAIAGFINRPDTEALLQDQPPGTFIVRLSDTSAGLFVISYVMDQVVEGKTSIKHYLVTPQDTSTKKSLAEFMRLNHRLVYLLVVSVAANTGKRQITRVLKDTALNRFYGKEKQIDVPSHYENARKT